MKLSKAISKRERNREKGRSFFFFFVGEMGGGQKVGAYGNERKVMNSVALRSKEAKLVSKRDVNEYSH